MKDQRRGRRVTQRRALLFICVTWGTSGCHGTSPPPADGRGEGSPPAADGVAPVRPSAPVPAPAPAPDAEVRGDAPAGPTNSASATAPSGVPATTADPAVVARAEALLRRYDEVVLGAPVPPPAVSDAGTCEDALAAPERRRGVGVLTSPRAWVVGAEARALVAVASGETPLAVRVEDPAGVAVPATLSVQGPHPWSATVRFTPAVAGTHRIVTGRAGVALRCDDAVVVDGARATRVPPIDPTRVWEATRAWGPAEEALYGAWVRELFHAPVGVELAWKRLDEVTSDPARNLLHGAMGWGEDSPTAGLHLEPDCADAPYFLRAYFAWKRGLPFAFRRCGRGLGDAPKCAGINSNLDAPEIPAGWAEDPRRSHLHVVERWFRRTLASGVHTGNARTAHGDAASDFYPLELTAAALDPGSIYADPYGHVFVVVEFVPGKDGLPGVLYAIDGQPDASITRKRFWEGNFLWNPDPALGGSGFKGFRPVLVPGGKRTAEGAGAAPAPVTLDDATLDRPRKDGAGPWADVDMSTARPDAAAFYRAMRRIITPTGEDPALALTAAVVALWEAAKVRVTSVDNGLAHRSSHPAAPVPMPAGAAIFETTGPWEDFATPARDLRLLVALDVVMGFPAAVAADPGQFGLAGATPSEISAVTDELTALRDHLLASDRFAITYTRSDGTPWSLRLADLWARRAELEAAYDPNDCAEIRWGVPRDALASREEGRTCDGQTTAENLTKLEAYRVWFRDRRRPPRGAAGPRVE